MNGTLYRKYSRLYIKSVQHLVADCKICLPKVTLSSFLVPLLALLDEAEIHYKESIMLPTPKKKNYTSTQELIEEIPQLRSYSNKHIDFNGTEALIRIRRKEVDKKPIMYLWDLDKSCYLSSLYPHKDKDGFTFEIGRKYYTLSLVDDIPLVKVA